MPDELVLERMTSLEVRTALDAGRTVAIVACGAIEQHGPHLPLFVDAEHGSRLAEEVAHCPGNVLVAPPIRVGCSEHHMRFAGSLSLRVETFEALCHDYCVSLARHGFRHVYFIPSHGGNFAPLESMLVRLNEAVGPQARVVAFTDLEAQIELWRRIVEEEAGLGSRVGGHADIAEGSIMLVLHPHLVHEDEAVPGYPGALTPEVLERVFQQGIGAVAPNGILGDARGLSEGIGRRCIAETADLLADYFRERIGAEPAGSR
jgi:creatinine amidohydrolase